MIPIDLITGFLGSGKTTFLKKYADYWLRQGCKIGILENDFGAVNVDMLLLQELMGDQCEVEMIAGACDADCHRRRFKTKLISMGMRGFDRILVEPSGIFDAEEFFDVLQEEPLDRWYENGNVIAVVDARLPEQLSRESEYLLASQIASAGQILLSRCQEASKEDMAATVSHLNRVMETFQCRRRFDREVLCKDWEQLTDSDFRQISECGYLPESYARLWFDPGKAFTSLYFMHVKLSEQELRDTARHLMEDPACGRVFRIKGFVPAGDGRWLVLNATREEITVQTVPKGQEIVIVIGEGLAEEAIKGYFRQQAPGCAGNPAE